MRMCDVEGPVQAVTLTSQDPFNTSDNWNAERTTAGGGYGAAAGAGVTCGAGKRRECKTVATRRKIKFEIDRLSFLLLLRLCLNNDRKLQQPNNSSS
jgi:hypothetical protein